MLAAMTEQAQRTRQRRRGEELEAALLEAAWDELVEVGFAHIRLLARRPPPVSVRWRRRGVVVAAH